MKKIIVTVGTKFRYTHNDANPLWEVKSARGSGTWNCVIVDCPDYSDTKKVFSSEEIAAAVGFQNQIDEMMDESAKFYANLIPGSVVHYKNGHRSWVRCRVTDEKELLPIALVGDWRSYDLLQRMKDGSIYCGYHVQQIQQGKTIRPNVSLIWEYRPDQGEPIRMSPIDLTLPPMTPEEAKTAGHWRTIQRIQDIIKEGGESKAEPLEIIRMIKEQITSY